MLLVIPTKSYPAVIELSVHVETVRSMLAGVLPGSIALTVSIAPDVWPIKVDAGELELALVNLFLNARDAMPHGGSLSLTAENVILARSDTAVEIDCTYAAGEGARMHAAIEEMVFYPAVREGVPDAEDEVLEGLEEHHIVKWTLSELESMPADDERFTPKVQRINPVALIRCALLKIRSAQPSIKRSGDQYQAQQCIHQGARIAFWRRFIF